MDNRLIGLSVAIAVSVILVGSLLVPVIQDAEDGQQYTYVNKGYQASAVAADVSLSWDATNGITLSDSTVIPSSAATNGNMVVLAFDTGFIKTNYAGTIASFYAYNDTLNYGTNITAMDIAIDFDTKTITLSNITASSTIADTSFTYSSWCYVPSTDGDKVLYAPNAAAADFYIEDDSVLSGFFYNGASWAVSLDDDTEVFAYGSPTYTVTLTRSTTEYNGLDKIAGITNASGSSYYVSVSDTDYYAAFVVLDRSATGISDVGESINPILAVIPIILIVSILALVVRSVMRR